MIAFPKNKKIILFDGVCNFCDSTVQKIIAADKKDQFRFTSLDSEIGKEILQYIGVDRSKIDSIVLYEPGKAYYIKSKAAFQIASYLGSYYSMIGIFSIFPQKLTDSIYDFIARNRYKWFGKKSECPIPSPEIRNKFL
ncbi:MULTISPECIES: thiol-disulfide oxidoreductase DCC family protein [Myroides]|uniref:DUF393 domain-containing protein n=1 Tax=Myroides albus TaxID=2562892 RepID=A0A6I3LHT3_9FLAO|nr:MULTISPECIES: DCC1-like thiol-disulfide oxidoreductase family protein [Myroides]MTG97803.1 DUF393 domain-containing protein [Myroides albus]MVX37158.1 DUF393 domain-containing protein [Myroides sp. LoEW2-1]UVD79760.1 DCC1-like thiol-disulfide oxidoreductase family protein [Myroides albus]